MVVFFVMGFFGVRSSKILEPAELSMGEASAGGEFLQDEGAVRQHVHDITRSIHRNA